MSKIDEIMEKIRTLPATPEMAGEKLRLLDEAEALLPPPTRYEEIIRELASTPDGPEHVERRKQLMIEGRQILCELHPRAPLHVKFVDDYGRSVFTIEQMAEALECSPDEVKQRMAEISPRFPQPASTGRVHRLH